MAHSSFVLQYTFIQLVCLNGEENISGLSATILVVIIGVHLVMSILFRSRYKRVSIAFWSLLHQRKSSRYVCNLRRFLLHAVRASFLAYFCSDLFMGIIYKPQRFLDRSRVTVGNILYASFMEYYFSYDTMDPSSRLMLAELAIAYLWTTVCSAASSGGHIHMLLAFFLCCGAASLLVTFIFTTAVRIANRYYHHVSLPNPTLSSVVTPRILHFSLPQLFIHIAMPRPPTYIRLTAIFATVTAILHLIFPKTSLFYGLTWFYPGFVQNPAWREMNWIEPCFGAGILSVQELEAIASCLQDSDAAVDQLRSLENYTAANNDKVAALSYKHFLPHVHGEQNEDRKVPVKIDEADLKIAISALKENGFTHVWTDFAQNARPGGRSRDRTIWFEEGVAPFVKFCVIAVWTRGQAMGSMWIRLEEMAGMLGKGLIRVGLDLVSENWQAARESYSADVDEISRQYGRNMLNGLYGYGPWSIASGEDFEDDFVYRSQVTLNMLVPLPGLMETNFVNGDQGLDFFINRGRRSSRRAPLQARHNASRLLEQFRGLIVYSRPSLLELEGELESDIFEVICECMSVGGQCFRSIFRATRTTGDVSLLERKWLGERDVDMMGFHIVEKGVWKKWPLCLGVETDSDFSHSAVNKLTPVN